MIYIYLIYICSPISCPSFIPQSSLNRAEEYLEENLQKEVVIEQDLNLVSLDFEIRGIPDLVNSYKILDPSIDDKYTIGLIVDKNEENQYLGIGLPMPNNGIFYIQNIGHRVENIFVHEVLHTLGLAHDNKKTSIMSPYSCLGYDLQFCDVDLDNTFESQNLLEFLQRKVEDVFQESESNYRRR